MMLEISHNLQTPLTIIKAQLEMLSPNVIEKKKIKILEKSISRVSIFIYDMLKLANLETTEESYLQEKINLSELLTEQIEFFEVLVKSQKIIITSTIEDDVFIKGKKDKIEEVLINLTSNAIKYIDNDKRIHFELHEKNNKVLLTIKDTGIGIDVKEINNIFKRFYRSEAARDKQIKGTGLGLAIIKKILDKHGAEISVSSTIKQGTTFIITFNAFK